MMINIDINILSKFKGKYFHKSIICIVIAVVLIAIMFTYLIIYHCDKLTLLINAL